MFYEDEDAQVVQLGKGDVMVAGIVEDTDLNTVVRLAFTDKKTIDVVIAELERAKRYTEDPKSHPDYEEIKAKNTEPVIPAEPNYRPAEFGVRYAYMMIAFRYRHDEHTIALQDPMQSGIKLLTLFEATSLRNDLNEAINSITPPEEIRAEIDKHTDGDIAELLENAGVDRCAGCGVSKQMCDSMGCKHGLRR